MDQNGRKQEAWKTFTGWCEFNTTHSFLPAFVREGMHLAIAEPWNNSSYEGDPGESCGECWEVDTIYETAVVMVTNLCPIEGNPLCSGGHFHFDLSTQAGEALGGGGMDEATAKRVPCPVDGNIHIQVNDSNEWGYLRMAFMNHLIPIREVDVRAHPDGEWVAAERSGGCWHVQKDGPTPDEGDGIAFRITSAQGETVESSNPVDFEPAQGSTHDLGVQFQEAYNPDEDCEFTPPKDVYEDAWGGIEGVQWQPNPWGDNTTISETDSGCFDGSPSCVRVDNMGQWEGAHFYYRQPFPVSTFTGLQLQLKAISGSGEITAAPSYDGERCEEQTATVNEDGWAELEFSLESACSSVEMLNAVTIGNNSETFDFLVDHVVFY